jgi:integrase
MGKLSCGLSIPGVFEKDGRYYKVIRNVWHPLSRIDEGESALYRALYELEPTRPGTIGELIKMYRAAGMDSLRESTRKRYSLYLNHLDTVFGKVRLGALKPSAVAVYLEKRRKRPTGGIAANREFAVLSSLHNFGMRQGWVEVNPCNGIRRNPEKPRPRVVTDTEFLEAFEASPEPFQDLIAAAYLTGARQGDVVSWKRSEHLKPEGIVFTQSKTGKPQTIAWSDALRFFVRRAMERFPEAEHVFTNRFGEPWGVWAINSQMRRLNVTWAFRDLRAKAQTDSPHSILGHGAAMEQVYRKMIRTRPVR